MDSQQLLEIGVLLCASFAVAILIFTFLWPYLSGEKQTEKRFHGVVESRSSRVERREEAQHGAERKQAVADTLKSIEEQQKKTKYVSLRVRLRRAGLDMTVRTFYFLSLVFGCALAGCAYLAAPTLMPPAALATIAAVGAFGFPRWVLSLLIKRRQIKFTDEMANAIDVIVRGVKSGLPVNECLGIVARENAEPLASEFRDVVEAQRVGVPLQECFERLCVRIPLPEVRFLAIVIGIQQSAGGSLSEALGNLSSVLRARKQLKAKVGALSAEAKASAVVLGAMPFLVVGAVYMTNPDYLTPLWTTALGQFMTGGVIFWMCIGVLIMRNMINFRY